MAAPSLRMTSGWSIPQHGLGTWRSAPGEVTTAVKHALMNGYTHIDCAYVYGNQNEVRVGIQDAIASGQVTREQILITSKLWNTCHTKADVIPAIKVILEELGLKYLDLLLVHWPVSFQRGGGNFPQRVEGDMSTVILDNVPIKDTWEMMEEAVYQGLVRSIGVSNFTMTELQEVLKIAKIKPAMQQIETHPYNSQVEMVDFCQKNDIVVTAYSPLGTPTWRKPDQPLLLEDPKVAAIAKRHNRSAGQVLIRWSLQRGLVCIPKSVTPSRIGENRDVFNFVLSDSDMATLNGLNTNTRFVSPLWRKWN